MTENAKLIEEARRFVGDFPSADYSDGLFTRMADALESAERRIEELEALTGQAAAFRDGMRAVEQDRDGLAAVIEQAKRLNDSQSNSADQWEDMNRILATADTDAALRERDARRAGIEWGCPNPYR